MASNYGRAEPKVQVAAGDIAGATRGGRGNASAGGQHRAEGLWRGRVESAPTWLQQEAQLAQSALGAGCENHSGARLVDNPLYQTCCRIRFFDG